MLDSVCLLPYVLSSTSYEAMKKTTWAVELGWFQHGSNSLSVELLFHSWKTKVWPAGFDWLHWQLSIEDSSPVVEYPWQTVADAVTGHHHHNHHQHHEHRFNIR